MVDDARDPMAVAALPLPSAPARPTTKYGPPRVALVGCGAWGRHHARVLRSLQALQCVCDVNSVGLERAATIAGDVPCTGSYAEVMADDEIDAVVLATPAATHHGLALQALRAGKHVLVEKPLALSHAEGAELVAEANRGQRILMVGHLLEYHPAVRALIGQVAAGELGTLRYVYSNRLNLGRVRKEENVLWSFAPHDLAVLLRLAGELPVEVSATGGSFLQPRVADVTVTSLTFASGMRGHVFVSWLHPYKEQRLVVVGSKRMAVFDDVAPDRKLLTYDQGCPDADVAWPQRSSRVEQVSVPADEPLQLELEHFLDCVATGERPLTDGRSALRVLRVLEAAQQSLGRGGMPVQLGAESDAR